VCRLLEENDYELLKLHHVDKGPGGGTCPWAERDVYHTKTKKTKTRLGQFQQVKKTQKKIPSGGAFRTAPGVIDDKGGEVLK